jgi:hypothetical protein
MNNDVPDVVAKLQALGSPGQIADFFRGEGITGRVKASESCPVANYIHRETGCYDASVDHYTIAYDHDRASTLDEIGLVSIYNTPVGNFVAGFDIGLFPDLEAGGAQ